MKKPTNQPNTGRMTFAQADAWAAKFISQNINPAEPITVGQLHELLRGGLMAGYVRGAEYNAAYVAQLEASAAAEKERGKN